MTAGDAGVVTEVAWSLLWNITVRVCDSFQLAKRPQYDVLQDETPMNCQLFLEQNGMDLVMKLVQVQ